MSDVIQGNAVIGQSGGPTAVINQSMVGVVEALRGVSGIDKILGARHAVAGIRRNDFLELQDIDRQKLDRIANTPAAALGSSRDKPDEEYCKKLFEAFEANNVRYFFYIGGNDSSDTCRIVHEVAQRNNYELRAFHVPKTIDNDLVLNDHTPGWGSAARFVTQAFMGDDLDNRALPGIKINVVMGRHAGFLTAASMLARQEEDDGPHLIYVPEADFDIDQFTRDVEQVYNRLGRCVVAVSEGVHDADGTPMAVKLAEQMGGVEKDAHGNVQLSGTGALGDFLTQALKEHFSGKGQKIRARADTFGYLQRAFVGCVSETDATEAREAGRKAGEAAIAGQSGGSVTINRVSDEPWAVDYNLAGLADVAGKTRTLDPDYIVDRNDIDESFRRYAEPIVGQPPVIEKFNFKPAAAD
jgi:6-phosphofructokinase 1